MSVIRRRVSFVKEETEVKRAFTPEHRAKLSKAATGRVHTEKTKAKIGAGNKRAWARKAD